ncbi:unnamed protein product [Oreochromis niloticus]|nr:unnamed protein product [Mustela putorius furo]
MEAVLGLMVILLGVSHGTHTQSECETGQFQCKSGACIPIMWRCDGDDDCPDSSDEENCRTHTQSECETGQFQCKSGACIRILWRCDGDDDCPDSSDEENCRTHTQSECETGQFQCKSGACIPIMWRCDGDDDCPDSSDEENCLAGVETHFDRRQDGAQCYGALGGTVDIQLMDSTSEIPRYQLLKNSLRILDVRRNKVISNTLVHRSHFFPSNGTFRINNLRRNDSGNYTLQTFNSDGYSSGERTLQLFIQAPVSSVLLLSECLSQGEMRVSCSSEGGDSPQYSWTLDGHTLTDAELLPGNNETNIITLKQHVSGHLVCSVRNNVSNVSEEQKTCSFINCTSINGTQILGWVHVDSNSLCIEPTTEPTPVTPTAVGSSWFIFGLETAVVILSLSGIWIWFTWKKKTILEGSAFPQRMVSPDNSVLMIEMSPYSNT